MSNEEGKGEGEGIKRKKEGGKKDGWDREGGARRRDEIQNERLEGKLEGEGRRL